MGFHDRLGPPFNSESARRAFSVAAYMSVSMGYELDRATGEITASYDSPGGTKKLLTGSPGEVLTDRRFYIPNLGGYPELVDLAFILGYLSAQLDARESPGEV